MVYYLPNLVNTESLTIPIEDRRNEIVCLANLRSPKNHINLLRAFSEVHSKSPGWKLNLIGRDFNDDYSNELKKYILSNELENCVAILGSSSNVNQLLQKVAIGVLSSDSEGLPLALLEYGVAGLAVVTTNVGNCAEVISTFGETVEKGNPRALANAILNYINNDALRMRHAEAFRKHILRNYSMDAVLPELLEIYRN